MIITSNNNNENNNENNKDKWKYEMMIIMIMSIINEEIIENNENMSKWTIMKENGMKAAIMKMNEEVWNDNE